MKIEKLSDNQIRCTITREDLAQRQVRLSDLAYGSDKARALFQDLMEQAAYQVDFHVDNSPIMVEAIPLGSESIELVVTKVDNPEELDTRFASFSPEVQKDAEAISTDPADAAAPISPFDQLLGALRRNSAENPAGSREQEQRPAQDENRIPVHVHPGSAAQKSYQNTHRLYSFERLGQVIRAAAMTGSLYTGDSALYRQDSPELYYLLLSMPDEKTVQSMQKVLTTLSEYGQPCGISYAREQYLREHCTVISGEDALARLADL